MKFIIEKEDLTFKDVSENQFFVKSGWLCQKVSRTIYNQITNSAGLLYADSIDDATDFTKIDKILPNVSKIEY